MSHPGLQQPQAHTDLPGQGRQGITRARDLANLEELETSKAKPSNLPFSTFLTNQAR